MKVLSIDKYAREHPQISAYMLDRKPWNLLELMVEAAENTGCPFPGGFLAVKLIDLRMYPPQLLKHGWQKEVDKGLPFRVVVDDYDSLVLHKLYADEAAARQDVELLCSGPVSWADLETLEIREY